MKQIFIVEFFVVVILNDVVPFLLFATDFNLLSCEFLSLTFVTLP